MSVSGAFFLLVFICFYCCLFLLVFLLYCLIASFNNKNNFFFAHEYVPLVITAKRIAFGSFRCSLTEDGIMFLLSYFSA